MKKIGRASIEYCDSCGSALPEHEVICPKQLNRTTEQEASGAAVPESIKYAGSNNAFPCPVAVPEPKQEWRYIEQIWSPTGESGYAVVTENAIIWIGKVEASVKRIVAAHNSALAEEHQKLHDQRIWTNGIYSQLAEERQKREQVEENWKQSVKSLENCADILSSERAAAAKAVEAIRKELTFHMEGTDRAINLREALAFYEQGSK